MGASRISGPLKVWLVSFFISLVCPITAFGDSTAAKEFFEFINQPKCDRLLISRSAVVKELLTQLGRLKNSMIESFPPTQFQVVGIGQSPSSPIASLQAKYEGYAFNLPLSAFRPLIRVNDVVLNSSFRFPDLALSDQPVPEYLSVEQERLLFDQFRKYIRQMRHDLFIWDILI